MSNKFTKDFWDWFAENYIGSVSVAKAYKKYAKAIGTPPLTKTEKQAALIKHIIKLGKEEKGCSP